MPAFYVRNERFHNWRAFEVPIIRRDGFRQGRLPRRYGAVFYYSPDKDAPTCAVLVTESGAKYLHQRKYARYLGRVAYSLDGIGHGEWGGARSR